MSDDLLAVCARIFRRRFDSRWSYSLIATEATKRGRPMSSETARKIVLGQLHRDVTVKLREKYAPQMAVETREPLTAEQYEAVYVDYHDHERSLSQIATSLGAGYDYSRVRRILQGEGEYEEPTAELRSRRDDNGRRRFPEYKQRTGRLASNTRPFQPAKINKAFHIYFAEQASLNDVRARTGIPKGRFKALVRGFESPELTAGLRARYGSELRPGGVVAGARWHEARGLEPKAATG
jgi:hypothetical protein